MERLSAESALMFLSHKTDGLEMNQFIQDWINGDFGEWPSYIKYDNDFCNAKQRNA